MPSLQTAALRWDSHSAGHQPIVSNKIKFMLKMLDCHDPERTPRSFGQIFGSKVIVEK